MSELPSVVCVSYLILITTLYYPALTDKKENTFFKYSNIDANIISHTLISIRSVGYYQGITNTKSIISNYWL
jgi:hypothetical protein